MTTDKIFPNGFISWKETFYEITSYISNFDNTDEICEINEIRKTQGTTALYDLAEKWADSFEKLNEGRDWDGEFFDEVYQFAKAKNFENF